MDHEDDDLSIPVPDTAPCKRLGCSARWEGEEVSRGDGAAAKCRYHPQGVSSQTLDPPIFSTLMAVIGDLP